MAKSAKPAAKKSNSPAKASSTSRQPVASKPTPAKDTSKKAATAKKSTVGDNKAEKQPKAHGHGNGKHSAAFIRKQHERLLELRDTLLDSMIGVARDNLRARAEGSEASAFGMHQADAGSDAYDRDFALNLLSQEQDALYEIEEALKRIEAGTYGICEISGEKIPEERLEAIPFARCTVACQTQLENEARSRRVRRPVTSLFGLGESESDTIEEESNE